MSESKADKVTFDDLLSNIKSTRNVNEVKHKLEKERWVESRAKKYDESRKEKAAKDLARRKRKLKNWKVGGDEIEEEIEAAMEAQKRDRKRKKVIDAPLHRQAERRMESRIAYRQTKNELRQWQPIVDGLRVAEQLQFPHDERRDDPLRAQTAEERAKGFTPRTELERQVAEVLDQSKSNIRNNEELSQAERELLKAMDLREAKRKCLELRGIRALMSFQAAKLKRQSKIKSKQFHRVRKRQERRNLIKEVETLLVDDPEKADEKLGDLERDRAYERATLKHRGTNKWTKQVRKFATRNPELRKVIEDQMRMGRELKGKHEMKAVESGSEQESDQGNPPSVNALAQVAADEAANLADEAKKAMLSATSSQNPFYRTALENIRRERKAVAKLAREKAAKDVMEEDSKKKRSRNETEAKDDDANKETGEKPKETIFLDLNVRKIAQIPVELAEGEDLEEDIQPSFLAEAYQDDDVLDDFEKKKRKIESDEMPKEKPSRYAVMRGWGSWTGEGISEKRELQRMKRILGEEPVGKKKERRRKDKHRAGVIIRECVSEGIKQLQPRDVPFPFTRIQDYEAYIQQPLGKEWNTPIAHHQLVQPSILTKAGRIIRPLEKKEKYRRKNLAEMIS